MVQGTLALWLAIGYLTIARCSAYSSTSETREVLSLDGVWNCYCERENEPLAYDRHSGLQKLNGTTKMPVPGGFLDFIAQMDPKSCPSIIWYERIFFVPKNWRNSRIWLRLVGISGTGIELWINGVQMMKTNVTHAPVERELSDKLFFDWENRITLAVDTRSVHVQFPGIPQSVSLRTVPEMLFIESVSVNTAVANATALITYKVKARGLLHRGTQCISVQALDMDLIPVASTGTKCGALEGNFSIPNCHLWWPMTMNPKAGYLYTLVFKLYYKYHDVVVRDVYRQKIGFRSLNWSNNSLTINGKNLYLKGVETNDEWASKPFNPRLNLKDIALLRWLNTNVLATKQAPSEEMLDLADELGFFVILGSPINALENVIIRYRNHPSVLLWSVSMDKYCYTAECERKVINLINRVRPLDSTRPFTAVVPMSAGSTSMVKKLDIVSVDIEDFSLENGYSSNPLTSLQEDIRQFQKSVLIMYGDRCISSNNGIRTLKFDPYPELNTLHKCFENLKRDGSVVGEMFGNLVAYDYFADKNFTVSGIFNRNREPTACADFIRLKFSEIKCSCPCRPPRRKCFVNEPKK